MKTSQQLPGRRPAARAVVRRGLGALSASTLLLVASGVLAAPAHADVPEGFSDPDPVRLIPALLVLGGVPVLMFALIALAVYLPAMARGERVAPGVAPLNDQWLGGPRQGTLQLAGPDTDESEAGGARGRW